MPELISLPITSVLAGFLVILLVPLSMAISMRRLKLGTVVFGDADDAVLRRRIRAHGNFIESAPIGILAIGLVELAGGPETLLWGLAGVFLGGRVLHATGMLYFDSPAPRGAAMLSQHVVCLLTGGWLLNEFLL